MMNGMTSPAPAWLRIAAVLGLLWNLFGVYAYLQTVGVLPGADPAMTNEAMPAWVTGGFAVAVFGGALGSLALLLLKRWSKLLLLLSFIGILVGDVWPMRSAPREARATCRCRWRST
jgi:hypothetical protein